MMGIRDAPLQSGKEPKAELRVVYTSMKTGDGLMLKLKNRHVY